MISTREDFKKAIEKMASGDIDGCMWLDMARLDDGRTLCLVLGWQDGYDVGEKYQQKVGDTLYTLCAKIAVNIDDLQCDYDVDWFMPWNEDGDVIDTDMAIDSDGDFDWYEHEATNIADGLNKGSLKVR